MTGCPPTQERQISSGLDARINQWKSFGPQRVLRMTVED
ncbi:hypothetical protein SynSYN20_01043 [Synechococcus sp. SYN20]|nr:hypothetical protein SynSYN20_01043 [Synechococcus sp. SYN20]